MNPAGNLSYDVFINEPPPQDNGLLPNGEPRGGSPVASTLILGNELSTRLEEHIVAAFTGIQKDRDVSARPTREQIHATLFTRTATAAVALPLIHVLSPIDIPGDQRRTTIEEYSIPIFGNPPVRIDHTHAGRQMFAAGL